MSVWAGLHHFDISTILELWIQTEVIAALAALAHPLRLQVFRALVVVGDAELTPGAIQQGVGVAPATLSFHLKGADERRPSSRRRASRNLIYRADFAAMNAVLGYLTEKLLPGPGLCPGGVHRLLQLKGKSAMKRFQRPCPRRGPRQERGLLCQTVCRRAHAAGGRLRQVDARRPRINFAISSRGASRGRSPRLPDRRRRRAGRAQARAQVRRHGPAGRRHHHLLLRRKRKALGDRTCRAWPGSTSHPREHPDLQPKAPSRLLPAAHPHAASPSASPSSPPRPC